jgi:hypothetical protein
LAPTPSQDQPVIVVREGVNGKERVLDDPNQQSSVGSVSALIWDVTPDGSLLAWARRKRGDDEFEVERLALGDNVRGTKILLRTGGAVRLAVRKAWASGPVST